MSTATFDVAAFRRSFSAIRMAILSEFVFSPAIEPEQSTANIIFNWRRLTLLSERPPEPLVFFISCGVTESSAPNIIVPVPSVAALVQYSCRCHILQERR